MCPAMDGKILKSSPQAPRIWKLFLFSQLNDVAYRKPGILSLVLNLSITELLASAPQICTVCYRISV